MSLLTQLDAAAERVYQAMLPTPQFNWPLLSERCGCDVWVKHENHAPTGAFKVRGGLNYLQILKETAPEVTGVIAATRGNHGQSIGFAANRVGLTATIIVPEQNNPDKNRAMQALGVELIEYGHDFQAAMDYAAQLATERNLHMVQSFDAALVHGVASYSLEFLRAVPDLDTVYVPIGLGSGICGMALARNALGLKTKIVGVVAENAAAYALSFAEKRAIATESADTLADGLACRIPNPDALQVIFENVERVVTVSESEILAAMSIYFSDTHNLSEGASAAGLAALLKEKSTMQNKRLGLILSGGNIYKSLYIQALQKFDH